MKRDLKHTYIYIHAYIQTYMHHLYEIDRKKMEGGTRERARRAVPECVRISSSISRPSCLGVRYSLPDLVKISCTHGHTQLQRGESAALHSHKQYTHLDLLRFEQLEDDFDAASLGQTMCNILHLHRCQLLLQTQLRQVRG